MNIISDLSNLTYINYFGRNYVEKNKVTFLNSLSGFEVKFKGKTLKAVFSRRGHGAYCLPEECESMLLRIRVNADGDMSIENSRVINLTAETDGKELTLAEFADDGEHTVLVRKMNYDWWGYVVLNSVSCNGEFLKASEKPARKILMYGDSITVGFGDEYNAVGDIGGDCPEKEDGTRSYSALFAVSNHAEIQEYCNSGMSIGVPCWREIALVDREYYKQYAYFDTNSRYDMNEYQPTLIICNLGTNDWGGLENGVSAFGNGTDYATNGKYTSEYLQEKYIEFIRYMTEYYPTAPIILMYGVMGIAQSVDESIKNAVKLCGRKNVYYCPCKLVECSQNAGHPTLAGQYDAYVQLNDFVKSNKIEF